MGNLDFGISVGIENAARYISDVDKMRAHSDSTFEHIGRGADEASGKLGGFLDQFPGLGKAIEFVKNPVIILAGILVGLSLAFATVVGSAEEFNAEFLQIQNLNIDKSAEQIDGLRDSILNAALATGKGAKEMSTAFFDIQSGTGLFGDDVDQIARKVASFSTATRVDFNTAIGASIKAIRAFHLEVKDLDGFLASSFATVQLGIVTFDQLSRVQTDFAGAAAGAGQNVDTANKIFAAFTATTKSAEEAATLTKTAFQDLGKKPTIDGLKSIGVAMYDANGAIRSTTDIVQDLVPKFKAMSQQKFDALLASIGGSEGLRGLLLQTRNEGEGLLKVFADFDKAKGAFDMEKLLANANGDMATLRDIVGNQLNTVFTIIGVKVLPTLARALNEVTKALPKMLAFITDNATALKALGVAAAIVGGGIAVVKVATIAYNTVLAISTAVTAAYEATILTLQAAYIALTGSTTIAAGAMKAFQILMASNPYTLAIAAVAVLAAGIYLLSQRTKELTDQEKLNIELSDRVSSEYGKQAAASTLLFDKLKMLDSKSVEYEQTLGEINTQYGEYLPNLLTNKSSLEDIAAAQEMVNAALLQKIRLQIKEQKLNEITAEYLGKSMNSQLELSKRTGISVTDLDKAVGELAKTGQKFSKEQFTTLISEKVNAGEIRDYVRELAKLPGISSEAASLLMKVADDGAQASVALLDLAFGTGQYKNEVSDINDFFSSKDPIKLVETAKTADNAAVSLGKTKKAVKEVTEAMLPASGSIALYELELKKLEDRFSATGDALERARIAERIKDVTAQIEAMKAAQASTTANVDPIDQLLGAANVGDPMVESLNAAIQPLSDLDYKLQQVNESFKEVAGTIQGQLTQAFGEAFFKFGQMIGMGNTAGEAAKAALLGLADVVLSQVPKYLGLFLLETAVGLGFPAGVPFALAGLGLLAVAGIAGGLLSKVGSASQNKAATQVSQSAPSPSAGLQKATATGITDFNSQQFDQGRQTIKIYLGGREVSDLIRQDIAKELDLQGG